MFAKPNETKPASPPSTAIGSGFAGLKPTPTVGKLSGFNPTSTSAPRTTPPVAKGAMSAIAQAKAALFERAQQANSSPTTPVMAPKRASISSITSITSVGSVRDSSSPTTPVSASPFRKPSVSSISNNFKDSGNSQMPSPTTPVSSSPFRKPSISTTNGFKEPTNVSQGSSPTTSSTPTSLRKSSISGINSNREPAGSAQVSSPTSSFTPTSLRKASISGMDSTWDPASVQATSTATPFTPKSLRKASISGMSHFKEPVVAPQTSLPAAPIVPATIRKLSISNGSGDNIREMVSGFKAHSRTPSVDAGNFKTRSRAPSVSVDVSAFQSRSRASSISAGVADIKIRSRSASVQLCNTTAQAPLHSVQISPPSERMVPSTELQAAVPGLAAADTPAKIIIPDVDLAVVSIEVIDKPVVESLPVETLTPPEEPTLVELPSIIDSSRPVETPIHDELATPAAIASALDSNVEVAFSSPETSSPTALAPVEVNVAESESTALLQLKEEPKVAVESVVAVDDAVAPTVAETLMETELISLIIPSKTKEEMLQSAPEKPVLSPVSSRASSHSRRSGVLPQKFHWKHGGEVVKVTGTFDDWKETVHLRKVPSTRDEFAAVVDLDRTKHIHFKFVVDGVWRCSTEFATEYDCSGNVNNVLPPLSLEQCASHNHH